MTVDFGTASSQEVAKVRHRWITPEQAGANCPNGRWGRRRVRVTECWRVIRVEELYTALLKLDAPTVVPGARDIALCEPGAGKRLLVGWEVRPNPVWRHGRLFLLCSRCERRCTRLYLPVAGSWPHCRRCWGLTYASRTLQNYKDSLFGRGWVATVLGISQRDWAHETTAENRTNRATRFARAVGGSAAMASTS